MLSLTFPPINPEGLEGGWSFGLESTKVHKIFVYCDASALAGQFSKVMVFLMVLVRCLLRNPVYPHRHNLSNRLDYVSKIKKMGTTVFLKKILKKF